MTYSREICSGIHDTQHCMENPEQAFVDYASSHTDEAGGRKAHLLGDKQIPSVGVFEEVTWKTFRGNAHDLGSILEEMGKEYDFIPKEGLKNNSKMVETTSGKLVMPSGSASNRVRKIVTTSGL
ncbi:hypothetical protein Tco_0098617 [Tanacetum coccineum]